MYERRPFIRVLSTSPTLCTLHHLVILIIAHYHNHFWGRDHHCHGCTVHRQDVNREALFIVPRGKGKFRKEMRQLLEKWEREYLLHLHARAAQQDETVCPPVRKSHVIADCERALLNKYECVKYSRNDEFGRGFYPVVRALVDMGYLRWNRVGNWEDPELQFTDRWMLGTTAFYSEERRPKRDWGPGLALVRPRNLYGAPAI